MDMRYPEIHTCAELTAFVDEIGFLPLLRWTRIANTPRCPMAAGSGRFGSGRGRLSARAGVPTASSLRGRPDLCRVNGGRISATGVAGSILFLLREALKRPYC